MDAHFANSFAKTLIEQFGSEGLFTVAVDPADMEIVTRQLESYGCVVERVAFRNELRVDTKAILATESALA